MTSDEATVAFYRRMAADYAARTGARKTSRDLTAFAQALRPGGSVLDFGCGGGWASRRLAGQGFSVTALDPAPEMLAMLADCPGVATITGDIAALPAGAGFDGVWAHFSLQHLTRAALPPALARLAGALRPGGLIAIGIHEGGESLRDSLDRLYNHWSEAALTTLLAAGGVTVEATRRHPDIGFDGRHFSALHLLARRRD